MHTTASGDALTSHTTQTDRLIDKPVDKKTDATLLKEMSGSKEDTVQRNMEDYSEEHEDTVVSSRPTDSNSKDQQEIEAEFTPIK